MPSNSMELSLRQTMKMSPQLLETMESLALSTDELKERITAEAEKNPTLIVRDNSQSLNKFANIYKSKTDRSENYSDDVAYNNDSESDGSWMERVAANNESLYDHLLDELRLVKAAPEVEAAAETIITSLDRNGFTGENPEEILSEKERPYFKEAISIVQALEPTGVGAKDWRDALMLQLKEIGAKDEELKLFEKLIYYKLDEVKAGKLEQVASSLRTDKEDVEAMLALLKTLTPFPGLKYSSDYDSYVTPELSIKKENGELRLSLVRDALPLVEIDSSYEEMVKDLKESKRKEDKEAEKFLKGELQSASTLINQLELRASTLERTGAVLMERQRDFFLYGPLYLKGLTMREVAEDVGVHEATISRIASNKYIDTDFGIYPIRSFFSSSISSEDGVDVSKTSIKERIKQIIEENKTGKALSDQKISDILLSEGIKVARRTVSKYRSELKIDSSFERSK